MKNGGKMTKKRFIIDDESDIIEFDWNTNGYIDDFMWGDGKSWDRVCNRLNELYEENEQLKQEIETGIESFKRIQRCHTLALVEENEQLKQQMQTILELTKKIEDCTYDIKIIGDYDD